MRIIIEAPPDQLPEAFALAAKEAADFGKYDKIGWGWAFGNAPGFFVRRIKDGLSLRPRKLP